MRKRKHDVEIGPLKQFVLPRSKPTLSRLRLALRAMPIAAGVIGDGRVIARRARINVTAERRCSATFDGAQYLQVLKAEPTLILFHKAIAACANEIGHLDGGPIHSGLRRRRESGTLLNRIVVKRSSGVEMACRCFLERWR